MYQQYKTPRGVLLRKCFLIVGTVWLAQHKQEGLYIYLFCRYHSWELKAQTASEQSYTVKTN